MVTYTVTLQASTRRDVCHIYRDTTGKHQTCARALFARWLELVHEKACARAMIRLTHEISDQRLLQAVTYGYLRSLTVTYGHSQLLTVTYCRQACFDALALSITTNGSRAPWVTREQTAFADREVWQTYFLRPELHSNWLRRKARWQRRRAERLAPGKVTPHCDLLRRTATYCDLLRLTASYSRKVTTRAISFLRGQLNERISIERELLTTGYSNEQTAPSNVSVDTRRDTYCPPSH